MSDISLIWFARHNDVKSLGGLAQKAKKHWPPPPPVSVRDILSVLGLPIGGFLNINLNYIGFQDGQDIYNFVWTDPGAGSPVQATSWSWQLYDISSGDPGVVIASGTVNVPNVDSLKLKPGHEYAFQVAPVNQFGTGSPPDRIEFTSIAQGPPPTPLAITATIDNNDVVTVVGKNFNKGQAVNIQATVTGPFNVVPNNARDLRNQYVTATADNNGSFTAKVAPQAFGKALFEAGVEAYVLAGESISVVAKNNNVGSFSPGPGVSNIVTMAAQSTVT